ncbi:hypothetical protein MYX78_07730 [Acidobacteria bacterium AH-259-G07]|nr:hypothetical protein [Acidobacteria bacterium AH-259-G07]
MLVIISDLHLTDGTSGETIRAGAFRAFRERLRDLAYDASWRADGKYKPIKELDLVYERELIRHFGCQSSSSQSRVLRASQPRG